MHCTRVLNMDMYGVLYMRVIEYLYIDYIDKSLYIDMYEELCEDLYGALYLECTELLKGTITTSINI